MTIPKTTRPARTGKRHFSRKRASEGMVRHWSALVGGALICATLIWFGWLALRQHDPGLATIRFPFSGGQNQQTTPSAADPLAAAGVTLSTPAQDPAPLLSEQQALLLAGEMEPQAAAHANTVSAQYVLFNYKGSSSTTSSKQDVPAWMVHYSKVAEAGPDTGADPHATNASHSCYLFLDANSGQELLALWI